ncbi:hypothetical protein [Acidisoma sp. 7E03]
MSAYQPPRLWNSSRRPRQVTRGQAVRGWLAMLWVRVLRPWWRLRDRVTSRRRPIPHRWTVEREMRRVALEIDSLELAARLGSAEAENRLADMADDHVGRERARLAGVALRSVRSRKN